MKAIFTTLLFTLLTLIGVSQTLRVNSNYNELSTNALRVIVDKAGTAANPTVITNANSNFIIGQKGSPNGTHSITSYLGDVGYLNIIGKSFEEPLVLAYNTSGVSLRARNIHIENVVVKDIRFAGVLLNYQGFAYKKIVLKDFRVFGDPADGEGVYVGDTDKGSVPPIDTVIMMHGAIYNKGRDGVQFNNVKELQLSYSTVYKAGQAKTSGQQALGQFQNTSGTVFRTIFYGGPVAFNLATHGLTFEECYINFDGGETYAGSIDVWSTLACRKGYPVTFKNCTIVSSVPVSHFIKWATNGCDIQFIDCKIYNINTLVTDARTDKSSGKIIIENLTKLTAAPAPPRFVSLDADNYKDQMKSDYYIGYHALKQAVKTYEEGLKDGAKAEKQRILDLINTEE